MQIIWCPVTLLVESNIAQTNPAIAGARSTRSIVLLDTFLVTKYAISLIIIRINYIWKSELLGSSLCEWFVYMCVCVFNHNSRSAKPRIAFFLLFISSLEFRLINSGLIHNQAKEDTDWGQWAPTSVPGYTLHRLHPLAFKGFLRVGVWYLCMCVWYACICVYNQSMGRDGVWSHKLSGIYIYIVHAINFRISPRVALFWAREMCDVMPDQLIEYIEMMSPRQIN